MKFTREQKRLAKQLVESGYARWLADGITLELATRQDENGIPYGYNEWKRLQSEKLGSIDKRDTIYANLRHCGAPGSPERLAALAEFYAPHWSNPASWAGEEGRDDSQQLDLGAPESEPSELPSPFSVSLDDIAARLAGMLASAFKFEWREGRLFLVPRQSNKGIDNARSIDRTKKEFEE